jgi:hypothetical protein
VIKRPARALDALPSSCAFRLEPLCLIDAWPLTADPRCVGATASTPLFAGGEGELPELPELSLELPEPLEGVP